MIGFNINDYRNLSTPVAGETQLRIIESSQHARGVPFTPGSDNVKVPESARPGEDSKDAGLNRKKYPIPRSKMAGNQQKNGSNNSLLMPSNPYYFLPAK